MAYLERLQESARKALAAARTDPADTQSMPPPPSRPAKTKPPAGSCHCRLPRLPKHIVHMSDSVQAEGIFNSKLSLQQQGRLA